jgi:hypothetical protein
MKKGEGFCRSEREEEGAVVLDVVEVGWRSR